MLRLLVLRPSGETNVVLKDYSDIPAHMKMIEKVEDLEKSVMETMSRLADLEMYGACHLLIPSR